MKKMMFALVLALAASVCGAALAEQGVAYGVYNQSGEQPDSLIRVTMNCSGERVTDVQIDEKLIPYSASGAAASSPVMAVAQVRMTSVNSGWYASQARWGAVSRRSLAPITTCACSMHVVGRSGSTPA